jgi:hypothetical protein
MQDDAPSLPFLPRWAGTGFGVLRRSDGIQVIPTTFGTLEAARSMMFRELYRSIAWGCPHDRGLIPRREVALMPIED